MREIYFEIWNGTTHISIARLACALPL